MIAHRIPRDKTEVVIVGTMHGYHDQNPLYSREVLRDILMDLRPAAICVELDSYYFKADGTLDPWVIETPELAAAAPETVVAHEVCSALGIQMLPFDIEGRQEFFRQNRYWERIRESQEIVEKWLAQLSSENPQSEDLEHWRIMGYLDAAGTAMVTMGTPDILNSDAHDELMRVKGSRVWHTILARYPEVWQQVGEIKRLSSDYWQEQNAAMADNISRIAERFRGNRIVISVGAGHRYILRDLLVHDGSLVLAEFWSLRQK